jgi:small redox-active disulfide protein 2
MVIKVLGTGCANCRSLEKATHTAIAELKIKAEVVKEEDITKIIAYGVLRTPALVIDERVVLSGKVPSVAEIKEIIQKAAFNT